MNPEHQLCFPPFRLDLVNRRLWRDGQEIPLRQKTFAVLRSEVELWQGLRPGEEERHEAIFSLLTRIPVDGTIARRAGQLRRQFGLERLSLPDAVIAASAELTGRWLLTRNTRDFESLSNLIGDYSRSWQRRYNCHLEPELSKVTPRRSH
jgi:predicted nucleic acid-binding protein